MKWWRLLFDLLFPKECAVCGRVLNYHEQHFCLECFADMPLTYFWSVKDNPAERVFWGRTRVERVYSLFYYTNNWRTPVHLLKYKGNIPVGKYLGKMLGEKIAHSTGFDIPIDYIVPVPLHWRKKMKRGYNQSEIIARGIAEGMDSAGLLAPIGPNGNNSFQPSRKLPEVIPNLLKRGAFTATQTAKDRLERWHNVSSAFRFNPQCRTLPTPGSHILLVDDVLTTGATLEACATILVKELGCRVSIATLAYVE